MAENAAAANQVALRGLVQQFDRDRYWAALFAPEPAQTHLMALYAFNVELSRIAEQVREPMFGEVRLQWWRDALEMAAAGEPTGHPVADALGKTRLGFGLPASALAAMIDARLFDIAREPMADIPALKTYLLETAGALFRLACRVTGAKGDSVNRACEHAALAYGLTGLLRALPYHAARGQFFLPAAHFAAQGVDAAAILRGEAQPGLGKALAGLRGAARRYLASFRAEASGLPPQTRPVFLPLALIEPYLDKMSQQSYRPLREVAGLNPAYRYWRIAKAHYRRAV